MMHPPRSLRFCGLCGVWERDTGAPLGWQPVDSELRRFARTRARLEGATDAEGGIAPPRSLAVWGSKTAAESDFLQPAPGSTENPVKKAQVVSHGER